MNRKIIAFSLACVVICGVFVGCKKKAADAVSIIVTDENGKSVTDSKGNVVTVTAIPQTNKDGSPVTQKATNKSGQVITDSKGNDKTVIVTEKSSKTTTSTTVKSGETGKVPYSTTAPNATKGLDEWTFGSAATVGCKAPNGWKNETVNQVVKSGTDIRVQINPKNYLSAAGYTSADQYAAFVQKASYGSKSGAQKISYAKEVYSDGEGIAMLYKAKKETDDGLGNKLGKYQMTYIFQTGKDIRIYFVYGSNEKEAKTSIADIIANTYYRG